jgi:hypothetical protein
MVMSGNADLWQQLMIERNRIIQKRKVEEILAANHAKKRKDEIDELLTWLIGGALALLLLGLCFWWLTLLMGK